LYDRSYRQTPKNHYKNTFPSRGSHNINKSIEFNTKFGVLSAERSRKDIQSSYTKLNQRGTKEPFEDSIRTMKTIKSVSHKNSKDNLFKGTKHDAISLPGTRYFNYANEGSTKNGYKKYTNCLNSSGVESALSDTPNKPKDNRNYSKPYKFPSSYVSSYRYRSTSHQNNLDSENIKESTYQMRSQTSKEPTQPQRKSQGYRNIHPDEDISINFGERVRARKAVRNREFEKIYQESSEGFLQAPPINDIGKNAYLKLDDNQTNTRNSLADQIKKHAVSQRGTHFHNIETLNSARSSKHTSGRDSRPSVLMEKDIPDEGNARRPDGHITQMKNFKMSVKKSKTY